MSEQKQVTRSIGWREWLSLPELGVPAIKAKIDTGAKTSALHTFRLEFFVQDAREYVRFWLHPLQKNTNIEIVCLAAVADRRIIRDSGGHEEERSVINTPIVLNGKRWNIELSLTSRENMSFRMLLGRSAIRRGAISVDPRRSYVAGKTIMRAYLKTLPLSQRGNRIAP